MVLGASSVQQVHQLNVFYFILDVSLLDNSLLVTLMHSMSGLTV